MSGPKRWPTLPVLIAGFLLTIFAAVQLDSLEINGDLYGLLGDQDPAVMTFRELAEVTTGLEELLVVCDPDQYMPRLAIDKAVALPEIGANTRTYIQPGKSSLYAFSLTGDPADFQDAGVVVNRIGAMLAAMAPSCGMAGTPAYIVETHERLNADLIIALAVAIALVTLLFSYLYRIGWLALVMLLPVGIGIAWGLAAYSLIRPELTLFAAAVPTLLIGIGIDHCIHMIQACRYSINHDGLPRDTAVLAAWRRLLRPITVEITPRLTWYPVEKVSAASRFINWASFSSSSTWISRVPLRKRDPAVPVPYFSSARAAAALISGWFVRPR